jgi:hypothetical protein
MSIYTNNADINLSGSNDIYMFPGSLLGVNGDYLEEPNFHTHRNGQTCDASTIQIGESTQNTNKFHIYSGGTLANYGNNNINISSGIYLPELKIDGGSATCNNTTCALNIFNSYGNINYNNILAPQVTFTASGFGPLWMDAKESINYNAGATFLLPTNNYLQLDARDGHINTTGAFSYTGGTSNYRFRAESSNSDFKVSGTTTIITNDDCGTDSIFAGRDILFGDAVTVTKKKAGRNTMHASHDFTVADGKAYTFDQNDQTLTNGDVLVRAGMNITMGGRSDVTREATTYEDINWLADDGDIRTKGAVAFDSKGASGKTVWHAGDSIITEDDVTFTHAGSGETKWEAGKSIYSTDCNDTIKFTHTGTGDIYWEATAGDIHIRPNVEFSKTNTNNGYTEWKAGKNIKTHNDITFTSNNNNTSSGGGTKWDAGDSIIVDQACAPAIVSFTNNSPMDDSIVWYAGKSIVVDGSAQAVPIRVNFLNKAQNADNPLTNHMKWHAHNEDIRIQNAVVNFTTSDKAASTKGKGYTEWYARQNIFMNNDSVTFLNYGEGASDNTYWHAETGDIDADHTPITFENNGTGYTWWQAGRDILLHHYSPTSFTDSSTAHWLKLEAGQDIRTGIGSPMTIDHDGVLSIADITLWAGRNVWTQSSADITNHAEGNVTFIYAGQDIRIDSTLTFLADHADGIDSVKLRANGGDIIVNTGTADIVHPDLTSYDAISWCDDHRAAVNFTLKGAGETEWWAKHNIIATDTIHFHYDDSGHQAGNILFHADSNNIDLRRPFKIDLDTASTIRLEALASNHTGPRHNKHSAGRAVGYNGTLDIHLFDENLHTTVGSIRTSDSVVIHRTADSPVAGLTEIEACNDIQTAMFDFTSRNQTGGDTTRIISRMGDLWLGYSWENPAACSLGDDNYPSAVGFDRNRFIYRVPEQADGKLSILSGYDDTPTPATTQYDGGNIYFTHIVDSLGKGGTVQTEISIPFSNMFICGSDGLLSGIDYERAGIIGGVARCQSLETGSLQCTDTGLIHIGNHGDLVVNAGTRGNIIINNGACLQFRGNAGNAKFLTQWGDIDMRHPFDVDSMSGDLLFYANSPDPAKKNVGPCNCDEKRNNVYLQDFRYIGHDLSGSVFIGADNNIKLQYGGLYADGTNPRDPFFNRAGYLDGHCGTKYHCNADTSENRARRLILNFAQDTTGQEVKSGGFAAVASDLIDIYKDFVYTGGKGSGMGQVPGYTTLHNEPVAGYGLYIKTRGDKKNWTQTDFEVNNDPRPTMGAACKDDACEDSYLHNTSRVTFHADARIYTEGQRALIASPVLESYGPLDLNTSQDATSRTALTVRTDSLIAHDSLIIDGPRTTLASWSRLYRNVPVVKLGHHRFTPPAAETTGPGALCPACYTSDKDTESRGLMPLDTLYVTFRNGAGLPRLHSLVADHAVLSFLTDSFDHTPGHPTWDAKIFTDTFKVRNHVDLIQKRTAGTSGSSTHAGHLELVSEPQMSSKNYAGIYTRHLHMEPAGPACSDFGYSQLWLPSSTLNVIATSHFGGFGWLHNDVYVEIDATVAPGYASLERNGNCYEQHAGILRMKDLRMDKGSKLKVSIGDTPNSGAFTENYRCSNGKRYNLGEYADLLDVDSLTLRDRIYLEIVVRPEGLNLDGNGRCYPILRYKGVGREDLKHLTLSKNYLSSEDHPSIRGHHYLAFEFDDECKVVSVCIVPALSPVINRKVEIPAVAGMTSTPPAGTHYVPSHTDFPFLLNFGTTAPLAVRTGRIVENAPEPELKGLRVDESNEYKYVIRAVREDILLQIGPDESKVTANTPVNGPEVWSHNTAVYIRVERENLAHIYSVAGHLVRQLEVPAGTTTLPLPQGLYLVVLQDGLKRKVVIK